jgi:hypothetical protein
MGSLFPNFRLEKLLNDLDKKLSWTEIKRRIAAKFGG